MTSSAATAQFTNALEMELAVPHKDSPSVTRPLVAAVGDVMAPISALGSWETPHVAPTCPCTGLTLGDILRFWSWFPLGGDPTLAYCPAADTAHLLQAWRGCGQA